MLLDEVLPKLAAILAPVADDDPVVYDAFVDAVDVPCLMLVWAEPWLDAPGACSTIAYPVVTVVEGRLEPGEGLRRLEALVARTLSKLRTDPSSPFAIDSTGVPLDLTVGGVHYLAARVPLRVGVTF